MTMLIASVLADSPERLQAQVEAAAAQGADAVELRLDLMEHLSDDDLQRVRQSVPPGLRVILTIRSVAEGGQWDGPDDDRVSRLIRLGPLADEIDVELALWRRSANIRQKISLALRRAGHITQAGGIEEIEEAEPRRLLLSRHDPAGRPAQLHGDWLEMMSEPQCALPKLAWRARSVRDNFEAFELMRSSPRPGIVICMGAEGIASRVLAKKFAAAGTFAAVEDSHATAPGQLSIGVMKTLYRWDSVDPETKVFGVLGDPVGHSIGPAVHNAAFGELQANAVYLPLPVRAGYESFKAFMVEALARPWLDLSGLSITIPHKENALRFLRETGGSVDERASRLGAVNTLTWGPDGRLCGSNTDYTGALEAITRGWGVGPAELRGRVACVLGAGGAARAVVAALRDAGMRVSIFNRTPERAAALAGEFECVQGTWEDRLATQADLLVNCTSLGLEPHSHDTPMPGERLRGIACVMDTVYRPRRTRLLREAAEAGCVPVEGLEMFLGQAAGQLQAWIGRTLPVDTLRKIAAAALSE